MNAAESFTYMVTDAAGNTATGTININIIDDVPSVTAVSSGVTAALDEGNTDTGAPPTEHAGNHQHRGDRQG